MSDTVMGNLASRMPRRKHPPDGCPFLNMCMWAKFSEPGQDPAALAGKEHHHVPGSVVVAVRHHLLRTGNVMPRWIDGERQHEKETERPRVSTTVDEEESTDGDEGWANNGEYYQAARHRKARESTALTFQRASAFSSANYL